MEVKLDMAERCCWLLLVQRGAKDSVERAQMGSIASRLKEKDLKRNTHGRDCVHDA
jgi:hypothetical protein